MREERYPGEQRSLWAFLCELGPVAELELGRDTLLYQAVRRALASGSLEDMRRARRFFNLLPSISKRRVSDGLVARAMSRARDRASAPPGSASPQIDARAGMSETGLAARPVRHDPAICPP
jgi:hypothetical protein